MPLQLNAPNMELATFLNVVSTFALGGALVFAGLQVRSANRAREEQNAIKLIEAALGAVLGQPTSFGDSPDAARALRETGFRLEALGYLVYRRVVPIQSVQELMGGMLTMWWARIKPLAERERESTGNPRMFEWAQWLAERVIERGGGTESEPAFTSRAHWK